MKVVRIYPGTFFLHEKDELEREQMATLRDTMMQYKPLEVVILHIVVV